ncbi:MAG: hypothetical protein ACYSWQ_06890 [Planctomycetota bacterium]
MIRVVENCRLEDGLVVKKLEHYRCCSCDSRFFDDGAMHRIQAERVSSGSPARSC